MRRLVIPLIVITLSFLSCGEGKRQVTSNDAKSFQQVIEMSPSRLAASTRDSIDFGRLKVGEIVEYTLGIRNADTTAMVILEILNSCGCTNLEYDKHPVLPGDTATVTLYYDSKGQFGTQAKLIQVITSFDPLPYNIRIMAEVSQ